MVFSLFWSWWKSEPQILVYQIFLEKKWTYFVGNNRKDEKNTLKLFDTFDQQLWKFSNLKIIA